MVWVGNLSTPVLFFSPGGAECRLLTAGTWSGPPLLSSPLLSPPPQGDIRQSSAPPCLSLHHPACVLTSHHPPCLHYQSQLQLQLCRHPPLSPPPPLHHSQHSQHSHLQYQQNKDHTAISGSKYSWLTLLGTKLSCYIRGNRNTTITDRQNLLNLQNLTNILGGRNLYYLVAKCRHYKICIFIITLITYKALTWTLNTTIFTYVYI